MAKQQAYNTNLASEFFVLSVLYRLGADATLTLGNKKSVDIVVTRQPGDAITIDVKAVAGKVDWLAGSGPKEERKRHFVVLLSYEGRFRDIAVGPKAWVLPHKVFLSAMKTASTGSLNFVPRSFVRQNLAAYEDAWWRIVGKDTT